MIKKIWTAGLASVVMMGIVGCGGGTEELTPAQRLVGVWQKACYQPADDATARYRTEKWEFKDDGTGSYEKIKYSDRACTLDADRFAMRIIRYEVGDSTVDSSGEDANKLDLVKDSGYGAHEDYTMFRFNAEGHLLIAAYSDAMPGDDDASRENYIDPSWHGYSRASAPTAPAAGGDSKPNVYGYSLIMISRHFDPNSQQIANLQGSANRYEVSTLVNVDVKCTDYQFTEADKESDNTGISYVRIASYVKGMDRCMETELTSSAHPYYGGSTLIQAVQ